MAETKHAQIHIQRGEAVTGTGKGQQVGAGLGETKGARDIAAQGHVTGTADGRGAAERQVARKRDGRRTAVPEGAAEVGGQLRGSGTVQRQGLGQAEAIDVESTGARRIEIGDRGSRRRILG